MPLSTWLGKHPPTAVPVAVAPHTPLCPQTVLKGEHSLPRQKRGAGEQSGSVPVRPLPVGGHTAAHLLAECQARLAGPQPVGARPSVTAREAETHTLVKDHGEEGEPSLSQLHRTARRGLGNVIPSELSPTKKDKSHMISLSCGME